MSVLENWEKRDVVRAAKRQPCKDCGRRLPYYCMDFDHVGEKKFNISNGLRDVTMEELLEEIAKTEIVCAVCHRIREFKRQAHRR